MTAERFPSPPPSAWPPASVADTNRDPTLCCVHTVDADPSGEIQCFTTFTLGEAGYWRPCASLTSRAATSLPGPVCALVLGVGPFFPGSPRGHPAPPPQRPWLNREHLILPTKDARHRINRESSRAHTASGARLGAVLWHVPLARGFQSTEVHPTAAARRSVCREPPRGWAACGLTFCVPSSLCAHVCACMHMNGW